jgi:hypothetical protein
MKSPDFDGNCVVDLADLSYFAANGYGVEILLIQTVFEARKIINLLLPWPIKRAVIEPVKGQFTNVIYFNAG